MFAYRVLGLGFGWWFVLRQLGLRVAAGLRLPQTFARICLFFFYGFGINIFIQYTNKKKYKNG